MAGFRQSTAASRRRNGTSGTLLGFRLKQRLRRMLKSGLAVRAYHFSRLLQISVYGESDQTYNLPDHVKHEKSHPW